MFTVGGVVLLQVARADVDLVFRRSMDVGDRGLRGQSDEERKQPRVKNA